MITTRPNSCPHCRSKEFAGPFTDAAGIRYWCCVYCARPDVCAHCDRGGRGFSRDIDDDGLRYWHCWSCHHRTYIGGPPAKPRLCVHCGYDGFFNPHTGDDGTRLWSCRSCHRDNREGQSAMGPTPDEVVQGVRCSCGGSSWSRSGLKTRYIAWTCTTCHERVFRLHDDAPPGLRFVDITPEGEPL